MGIYIYSLRSKTVSLDGIKANLYAYAYKQSSIWPGDYGFREYSLVESNTKRHAANVFQSPRTGLVVMGTANPNDDFIDSTVYKDVTKPIWYDCDRFEGTPVGFVARKGKKYTIADRTGWSANGKVFVEARNEYVPYRSRSIMVDGKIHHQQELLA